MNMQYLAGYVDGDGSICCRMYIQNPRRIKIYESSLQICSVDENICKFFKQEFTGNIHKRSEKRANRRPTWLWYIKGKHCFIILQKIIPFLVLKRKSSVLCISLIEDVSNSISYKNKKISIESLQKRDQIIKSIKEEIHMNDRVTEENFNILKGMKQHIFPSKADLAYFAGLIDAEGCFRIQHWQPKRIGRNKTWVICLEIGNTKFPIFPWLIDRFGGNITYRKPTKQRHNPMIIWSLKSDALFQILTDIYPFLRIKKEKCQKLGEFHQTGVVLGGNRKSDEFKNNVMDILHTRTKLFDEFQILNKKGNH